MELGYRDDDWAFEIAKEYTINKKNPVIVGYFQNWHYAIGYGILEIRMETVGPNTYLLKINRGWGTKDDTENDATISPKDIFLLTAVIFIEPLIAYSSQLFLSFYTYH